LRTIKYITYCLLFWIASTIGGQAQTHTEFKAKNFPPSRKVEFNKAFLAFKEGEKQYKLIIKENNTAYWPSAMSAFQTAYAFNPNHITLNRYIVSLLFMKDKNKEVFPYLEKLYDMKADLSQDEHFMLASLLQSRGSFTRAEIIFRSYLNAYGNKGDFWAEGRLQNAEKRIEECKTGENTTNLPIHFSVGKDFVKPIPFAAKKMFYNHYYGWWAFDAENSTPLSSGSKKSITSMTNASLHADLNAMVFISNNDTVFKQVAGRKKLELEKLNGNFTNRDPYLSNNLRVLYFSSDRPGGFGGFDIWIAQFDEDGKFTSIKNAGAHINDKYDQLSPSLSADGKRFFMASNGTGTTGGFDILYGKSVGDSISELKNLGFPVNSGYDEKAIIWDITGTKGFIKRAQYDSLYFVPFRETGSMKEALFIGTGFSSANIGPLSSTRYESGVTESFINGICKLTMQIKKSENVATEIEIFNLSDGKVFLKENLPDTATTLAYLLPSLSNYGIHINGLGLVPYTANLNLQTDEIFLERSLQAKLKPIKKGTSFVLENIFFSKDYTEMDKNSDYEIQRIAAWLQQHPKVKVEIAVHTDSLSMHSTVIAAGESAAFQINEDLKSYGIEKRRLDWMFYGSEKPIYLGKDMQQSNKNRRIELIITDK